MEDKIVEFIMNDMVVRKYMCEYSWVSGSQTIVAPITCWVRTIDV